MNAYKFLAAGAVAPFTGFRWPRTGQWVTAPREPDRWVHACRLGDLPYWLDEELWRVELEGPVQEARYQIAAPRARLVERVAAWDAPLRQQFADACAWRARDLALPRLAGPERDALAAAGDLQAVGAAATAASGAVAAAYVGDAVRNARDVGPATTSYIACVLASSFGGGLDAFEAERAWQSEWLADRLALERPPTVH